jgi:multidrug efflux pump subunit AcrA (membrane-fusion protein)
MTTRATAAGAILASLTIAACGPAERRPMPAEPQIAAPLGRPEVADVHTGFEAGGVVRAKTAALVASRILAPITLVSVSAGDRVHRGDALVRLDARDAEAGRAQAEAAARAAREAVGAAEAEVRAAESALVLARANDERMRGLHDKRSATSQELDEAVAALAAAEARRAGAKARVESARAAAEAAGASVDAAAVATTFTVLSAPFDGIVTERHADPGSMAAPGVPLLTVEGLGSYRLEVPIDEARSASVAIGQSVPVRLDSLSSSEPWADGRVVEMERTGSVSHTFRVKIDLPDSPGLRSGLFGRARFNGPPRRALLVPQSALIGRGQLTFAYVVDGEGLARLRPVSPGVAEGDRVEVLAGLRDSDQIVTKPPAALADGSRIVGARP